MPSENVSILVIAGNLRRRSFNRGPLRAAEEVLPAGATSSVYERLGDLPPYN